MSGLAVESDDTTRDTATVRRMTAASTIVVLSFDGRKSTTIMVKRYKPLIGSMIKEDVCQNLWRLIEAKVANVVEFDLLSTTRFEVECHYSCETLLCVLCFESVVLMLSLDAWILV